ncbi:MAG: cytochrome P450 [Gemmataceae bacterium]
MATARVPPGPKGRFLSGSLKEFIAGRLDFLSECAAAYGDVSSFRFGPRRVYLVNHPDLIEQVLVTDAKHYVKHFGARMYKPVLGNGLVTSEGDFWLRQRRLAQPAFLRPRLAGYAPVMVALTQKMLDTEWRDGLRVDVHGQMSRLTSAIALKTLFDLDRGPEADSYTESLREVFHRISARFRSLIRLPFWVPTRNNIGIYRAQRRLRGLVDGFIRQGRSRKEPGDDLLSLLIFAQDEDGRRMTDRQLRDEATTLYLAGHETTALTLSWTWYALAQHPRVEEKLVAEWAAVLGGRAPTADDVPRLPYTECVITEAMRLYPPVYLVGREPLADRELGGYRVPRGTTLFMSQWVTQRDGRFYDDPLEFRPERWADGLAKRLPKYAYFPFGGGPRVCIGNGFAMMEAVLLLATFGQQYRFTVEPDPPVGFDLGITLMPLNGIPAVLRRR